jgi:hypothetical protein
MVGFCYAITNNGYKIPPSRFGKGAGGWVFTIWRVVFSHKAIRLKKKPILLLEKTVSSLKDRW